MFPILINRDPADWLQKPLLSLEVQEVLLVIESDGSCKDRCILMLLGGPSTPSKTFTTISMSFRRSSRGSKRPIRKVRSRMKEPESGSRSGCPSRVVAGGDPGHRKHRGVHRPRFPSLRNGCGREDLRNSSKDRAFPETARITPEFGLDEIRERSVYSDRVIYRAREGVVTIATVIHGKRLLSAVEDRLTD